MKVLDLVCDGEHVFEGWFASEDDFQSQLHRHLVQCPMCGSDRVHKKLSAPRLNLGHGVAAPSPDAVAQVDPVEPHQRIQSLMWQTLRQVVASTEDVGERFAQEARKMHHGETESRNIRGVATQQETAALLEEGIGVLPLPLPEAMKNTLQ